MASNFNTVEMYSKMTPELLMRLYQNNQQLSVPFGRVARLRFLFVHVLITAMAVVGVLLGILLQTVGEWLMYGVWIVVGVLATYLHVCNNIKRFHDMGLNAWWVLTLYIPVVQIVPALMCLFKPGQLGPNQYGLDPTQLIEIVPPEAQMESMSENV